MNNIYYVYILKSDKKTLYTGISTDLRRRLTEHIFDKKRGAKYTKTFRITEVVLVFVTEGRSAASKIESHIKSLSRAEKEILIQNPTLFCQHLKIEKQLQAGIFRDMDNIKEFLKKLNQTPKKD